MPVAMPWTMPRLSQLGHSPGHTFFRLKSLVYIAFYVSENLKKSSITILFQS
jgi:hypothetical protein